MSVELVPFKEEHREAVVSIENAIFPEYQNDSVNWRAGQQFDDSTQASSKYVAFEINRDLLVGYGAIRETYTHRYRLNLMVDPEWQRRGVGRTLFAKLEENAVLINEEMERLLQLHLGWQSPLGRSLPLEGDPLVRISQMKACRQAMSAQQFTSIETVQLMKWSLLHSPVKLWP